MATMAPPLIPGLPGLAPAPRKGRRRCAPTLTHGWTLTPLVTCPDAMALSDFLTLWYARVRQEGEHASLWGQMGLSPTRFVLAFTSVPLLLLHDERSVWHDADGLMMACWLDDAVPNVRARVHQWVAPPYRHPKVSLLLGHALLHCLFEHMGLLMLEGRTPVGNRAGVRYARRLGFRHVATLPYGELAWTPEGSATITPVWQSLLTREEWRATQADAAGEDYALDV